MKRKILILLLILAVYLVLYIAVRATHHGIVQKIVVDPQGPHQQAKAFQGTCFVAPLSGFARFSSRALFVSFYPLGSLEHLITGRLYLFADQREAPIMKPQPNTALEPTPTAP